jgi:hypothetical protein
MAKRTLHNKNNCHEDPEESGKLEVGLVGNEQPFRFSGFTRPESNYFRMPNNWTDITAQINSLAELKVVEYILRHTWGYQEFGVKRRITVDEFMHGRKRSNGTRIDMGTRLSEQSVRNGLKQAIEDGFILEEVDARDRARIKKYYSLRMAENHEPIDSSESAESIHQHFKHKNRHDKILEVKTLDPEVHDLDPDPNILGRQVKTLDPDPNILDLRSQNFRPRTEKANLNKPNQTNRINTDSELVELLLDYGVMPEVARELASRIPTELILDWIRYIEHSENIRDKAAFLVKVLRNGETPKRSRTTGRAQREGIDFSRYIRPGGKYYHLVQGAPLERYLEED